jgi:hypothetical protein
MIKIKKEFTGGVENKRRTLVKPKIEYIIYGIFYEESPYNENIAACAAESKEEAESFLEKALEKKGFEFMRSKKKPVVEDTSFKSFEKGIIYGYDSITRSRL